MRFPGRYQHNGYTSADGDKYVYGNERVANELLNKTSRSSGADKQDYCSWNQSQKNRLSDKQPCGSIKTGHCTAKDDKVSSDGHCGYNIANCRIPIHAACDLS